MSDSSQIMLPYAEMRRQQMHDLHQSMRNKSEAEQAIVRQRLWIKNKMREISNASNALNAATKEITSILSDVSDAFMMEDNDLEHQHQALINKEQNDQLP